MVAWKQKEAEVIFKDTSDLANKLKQIDGSVPRRTEKCDNTYRKTCEETYCIKPYLDLLSQNNRLIFPLRVVKGEAPDFLLYYGGKSVALEITRATEGKYQKQMKELEELEDEQGILSKEYRQKLMEISGLGGRIGTEGDISKWCNSALLMIEKKTKILNGDHFDKTRTANRYELLIYDNNPERLENSVSYVERAKLVGKLRKVIPNTIKGYEKNFHIISVLSANIRFLLYDVLGVGICFGRDSRNTKK